MYYKSHARMESHAGRSATLPGNLNYVQTNANAADRHRLQITTNRPNEPSTLELEGRVYP